MTPCNHCHTLRRRLLLLVATLLPFRAFAKGGPRGDDPQRSAWFANQKNMMGGMCCELGDAHELDPGDVRYNEETGLYSVRLPDPSEKALGKSLDGPWEKPKQWVEIAALKMRDPERGTPPVTSPVIWFDTGQASGEYYYSIYCFEPNAQL